MGLRKMDSFWIIFKNPDPRLDRQTDDASKISSEPNSIFANKSMDLPNALIMLPEANNSAVFMRKSTQQPAPCDPIFQNMPSLQKGSFLHLVLKN